MIKSHDFKFTTTGSAGSATGSASTQTAVNGRLVAVHINYTSQPATTDVTLTATVTGDKAGAVSQTLLTLTNANTDGWFYPRVLLDDTVGADLTTVYDTFALNGYVTAAIAQGDAVTDALKVMLLIEEY